MKTIQYFAIAAVCYCIVAMSVHLLRVVRLGAPKDLSEPSGSVKEGVVYSNTRAMLPDQKESAYLHLPSYAVGMLFHIGVFCSLLLFILSFFPFFNNWVPSCCWAAVLSIPSGVGAVCGVILFLRRALSKALKEFSTADDFISVALVAIFQLMTFLYVVFADNCAVDTMFYVSAILLFLYMSLGKLRHAVYFFAARFHLGYFYGRRNVWPPKEDDKK